MSVKIEILDYKYNETEGTQMISNSSFTSSADWDLGIGWAILGGSANHSSGTASYLKQLNLIFTQGQTYRIKYKISGRTTGNFVLANHLANNANGFSQNTNGEFVYDWVQGGSNNDRLSLYGSNTFNGSIEYVRVYPISGIDWDNSIVGELDVTDHSDFPLALTFQISEFKDLTSTSGDYSKTFKLPATKNNNNIFKHLYTPNIKVDNKVTDKKACRILFNNLYSLVGLIQVDGVGGYGETPSYYNCVFFGSNLSWASKIQDTYMNTISWGDEGKNLTYNKDSIVATWQHEDCNNASNSPIVYPITSYGDYNTSGQIRTIQLLDTALDSGGGSGAGYYGWNNGGTPSTRNYGTPQPSADWRPSVFVKTTLDNIFAQVGGNGTAGYKINSAFMETDMFKKLVWLLPNFKYNDPDQRVLDYSVRSNFENGVSMTVPRNPVTGTPEIFPEITEDGVQRFYVGDLSDDDGNYYWDNEAGTQTLDIQASNLTVTLNDSYVDMVNNYVTIEEYGIYKISLNGLKSKLARAYKGGGDDRSINSLNTRVMIQVQTVGQTTWNTLNLTGTNTLNVNTVVDFDSDANTDYVNISPVEINRYLNKGDKIRLRLGIRLFAGDENQNFLVWVFYQSNSTSNFNIEINPNNVEYGQTYNLTDVINTDYKQIDFVKGVAHAFNLQMTTDETTKTVNIEPFDSFYKPYGQAIDWTYKLDRSSEISDKWIESDLKRTLVFKYKSDDADAKVKSRMGYFHDIEDEYPYHEILPDTFKKGDSTFENPFFAGTFNGKDEDTTGDVDVDTAYSACLWTEVSNPTDYSRPTKGYDFLPRLLYWNKYTSGTSFPTEKYAVAQTWASTTGKIISTTNYSGAISTIYPQATMINMDSISSPNLAYGNAWIKDYDDTTGVYAANQIGEGLYDTYYRNMIEMLKKSPRLRTVSISLNISDIVNLDFTKLVYIDGVYWRINKIVDYSPNKNESTKVELIEWFQIGVFAAAAPSFGSSGGNGGWGPEEDSNYNIGL